MNFDVETNDFDTENVKDTFGLFDIIFPIRLQMKFYK